MRISTQFLKAHGTVIRQEKTKKDLTLISSKNVFPVAIGLRWTLVWTKFDCWTSRKVHPQHPPPPLPNSSWQSLLIQQVFLTLSHHEDSTWKRGKCPFFCGITLYRKWSASKQARMWWDRSSLFSNLPFFLLQLQAFSLCITNKGSEPGIFSATFFFPQKNEKDQLWGLKLAKFELFSVVV